MAEISGFVVIDANNVAGWPKGMPFNQVNNAERKDEGLLARWYQDTNVVFPPVVVPTALGRRTLVC
jgi:hypothetical protein